MMLLRHELPELTIVLAVIAVALVIRLAVGNPNSVRHRTRMLRWRIRLYLRPGHGYANIIELAVRWSRLRAIWIGRRSPSLPWWARVILPVTAYAIRLGRAQLGKRVIASMEEQVIVVAAPRTGKSGWLADRIIDHPVESSRPRPGPTCCKTRLLSARYAASCTCSTPRASGATHQRSDGPAPWL